MEIETGDLTMISEQSRALLRQKIRLLYPEDVVGVEERLIAWLNELEPTPLHLRDSIDETDVILITYGDTIQEEGEPALRTLRRFLAACVKDAVNTLHLLPIYPYTSDDGFSVTDYRSVNAVLGGWSDVEALRGDYSLMLDAVINHASVSGKWFQEFLKRTPPYDDYFIVGDPSLDYSSVSRPRASPLLTPFTTREGLMHIWTTFSADQADLNYHSAGLLIEILDLLVFYARKGAHFLRLDAIGYAWKKMGTDCQGLPETHELIKLMRAVLDICAPGTLLVTETNVPHADNIRYLGDGNDEASMVYQFPLPPLTLHAFLSGDASKLSAWLDELGETKGNSTFFNFLASHDGIGLRPTEGILDERDKKLMLDKCLEHGGRVSYRDNGDATQSPYELNINYFNALSGDDEGDSSGIKKFLAAHCLLFSLAGVPGLYIHSLLGSRNDVAGMESSGINRRINREKPRFARLMEELENSPVRRKIFQGIVRMLLLRKRQPAFSPSAEQKILHLDPRAICFLRRDKKSGQQILVVINVSNEQIALAYAAKGVDLFADGREEDIFELAPYEYKWILCS
jgi:sucrose phosphorylase